MPKEKAPAPKAKLKSDAEYAYAQSPRFDAVQDVQNVLGDDFDTLLNEARSTTDVEGFTALCAAHNVSGFPVSALYDHVHGQYAWATKHGNRPAGLDDLPA